MQKTVTFLMFSGPVFGKAEEAIHFYISLFNNSEIKKIEFFGDDDPGGKTGTVKRSLFTIEGTEYMAFDSFTDHKFNFTPSISIFVNCRDEDELIFLFGKLSEGGKVLMAPGDYGFSKRFAWTSDRYGISWQLNFER